MRSYFRELVRLRVPFKRERRAWPYWPNQVVVYSFLYLRIFSTSKIYLSLFGESRTRSHSHVLLHNAATVCIFTLPFVQCLCIRRNVEFIYHSSSSGVHKILICSEDKPNAPNASSRTCTKSSVAAEFLSKFRLCLFSALFTARGCLESIENCGSIPFSRV